MDVYPPASSGDKAITAGSIEAAVRELLTSKEPSAKSSSQWGSVDPDRVPMTGLGAVCLRCVPNTTAKKTRDWSGSNPAFLTGEAAHLCRRMVADPSAWAHPEGTAAAAAGSSGASDERSTGHLLVDLPSVDKEDDGGALIAHRTFFGVTSSGTYHPLSSGPAIAEAKAATPPAASGSYMPRRTITELCFFDDSLPDGLYALSLQAAPIELDAAPSRPLLAPLVLRPAATS